MYRSPGNNGNKEVTSYSPALPAHHQRKLGNFTLYKNPCLTPDQV